MGRLSFPLRYSGTEGPNGQPGVVAPAFHPSTWESVAGNPVSKKKPAQTENHQRDPIVRYLWSRGTRRADLDKGSALRLWWTPSLHLCSGSSSE